MAKAIPKSPTSNASESGGENRKGFIAHSVFVEVATGGKRPAQELIALHEIPLLERKLRAMQSSITSIGLSQNLSPKVENHKQVLSKPQATIREHIGIGEVEEIFQRLSGRYRFLPEGAREGDEVDLVEQVYGIGTNGVKALAITMRKLHAGYVELVKNLPDEQEAPTEDELKDLIDRCGPRAALEESIESEIMSAQ
jgi:hypothetical protein